MANGLYVPRVGLPQSISPGPSQLRAVPDTSGISKVLSDVSLRLFQEHNEAMARDAVNNFRAIAREKNVELLSRKGKDADGASATYDEWYKSALDENLSKLGNPAQRDIFKQTADEMAASDKDQLALHEANEHRVFLDSTFKGDVARWESEIRLKPTDETLSKADSDIIFQLNKVNPGKDNSAEYARIRANNYITAFETISAKDPKAGAAFAERHKNKLGGAYNTIIKESKAKTDAQLAQDTADGIRRKYPDHASQYKAALQIKDVAIRTQVINHIEAVNSDMERIKAEQKRKNNEYQLTRITNAKSKADAMKIAYQSTGEDRIRLIGLANSLFLTDNQEEAKRLRVQSPYYYAEARKRIDAGEDPATIAVEYGEKMTPTHISAIFNYKGNKDQIKDADVRRYFKELSGGKDPKKYPDLYDMTWEYVRNGLEPGRSPNQKMIRDLTAEALTQGEIKGKWYQPYDPDITYVEAKSMGLEKDFFAEGERKSEFTQTERFNAIQIIKEYNKTAKIPVAENERNITNVIKQQRSGK